MMSGVHPLLLCLPSNVPTSRWFGALMFVVGVENDGMRWLTSMFSIAITRAVENGTF
ncbi:hypothetical protein M8C21_004214 [Ambrosia artemisiifolia]|uniref:Uncharacterized protein n=1 Tax=Ambrosia artemisiifolia TaxID=4212 RepID=A0AAD5G5S8_AMBAR|nr:hypothetical protein M8C21_004214 [Ambrosia artemisiifolia]